MTPFSRMLTFCWINNRPCKHYGTAPSLAKIISLIYFRESSLLKQVKRAHVRFRCKVLPIPAPKRINPQLSLWKDLGKEKVVPARVKSSFLVTLRHATARSKSYRSTQSLRRAVKTTLLRPHYPCFLATIPVPAERFTLFAFGVIFFLLHSSWVV